jgi:hypothetical protein
VGWLALRREATLGIGPENEREESGAGEDEHPCPDSCARLHTGTRRKAIVAVLPELADLLHMTLGVQDTRKLLERAD